jgi:hypothetical protein
MRLSLVLALKWVLSALPSWSSPAPQEETTEDPSPRLRELLRELSSVDGLISRVRSHESDARIRLQEVIGVLKEVSRTLPKSDLRTGVVELEFELRTLLIHDLSPEAEERACIAACLTGCRQACSRLSALLDSPI